VRGRHEATNADTPASGRFATASILCQREALSERTLWDAGDVEPTTRQAKRLERIRRELASLGPCLPGSLTVRTGPCGNPRCSCRDDPPRLHGPFRQWTRKVSGKTVTRLLTEEQLDDYQALFDNHRRLKELVHELEDLSLEIVERDRRWQRRGAVGAATKT